MPLSKLPFVLHEPESPLVGIHQIDNCQVVVHLYSLLESRRNSLERSPLRTRDRAAPRTWLLPQGPVVVNEQNTLCHVTGRTLPSAP